MSSRRSRHQANCRAKSEGSGQRLEQPEATAVSPGGRAFPTRRFGCSPTGFGCGGMARSIRGGESCLVATTVLVLTGNRPSIAPGHARAHQARPGTFLPPTPAGPNQIRTKR